MEITIEEIQKKFEELPEDIKWAIVEADVENKILEIGKKEELNVSQMGQLALEVNTVILGFYPPEKFEESLKASLQLPADKTKMIVEDVNNIILKTIREKMKENRTETTTETMIPNPVPAPINNQQTPQEKADEILKSAGVANITLKEILQPKIETPAPSIIPSKLTGSFQMPAVKTEYSLQNISKAGLPATPSVVPMPTTIPKAPTIKVDPYREATE